MSFQFYFVCCIYKKSCNIFKKKTVGRSNKTELCIIGAALQLRKFEGTIRITRSCKLKNDRHYNDQKKKNRHYNDQKKDRHYNDQKKKNRKTNTWSTKHYTKHERSGNANATING